MNMRTEDTRITPEWDGWLGELNTHLTDMGARLSSLEAGNRIERAAFEGRAFRAGSGVSAIGAGNSVMDVTLENPSTTGEIVVVHQLVVATTVTGFGTLLVAAPGAEFTNPVPGAGNLIANARIGGPACKQVMRSRVSTAAGSLGGGVASSMAVGAMAGTRVSFDLPAPIIVPPGVTLGLTFPFVGVGTASMTVLWCVEPL